MFTIFFSYRNLKNDTLFKVVFLFISNGGLVPTLSLQIYLMKSLLLFVDEYLQFLEAVFILHLNTLIPQYF